MARQPTIISFEEEMERLDRTVGVLQLAARLRNRDLQDFFENNGAGKVKEAKIVKDPKSGISKGIAYVEFEELESVEKALRMSGTKIIGIPCMVQRCESEKQLLLQQVQNGSFGNPQVRFTSSQAITFLYS
jgi:RNA-binding protein 39